MNQILQKVNILELKLQKALSKINNYNDQIKKLFMENQSLSAILKERDEQLVLLQDNYQGLQNKHEDLNKNYDLVKNKIEKMLSNISELEMNIQNQPPDLEKNTGPKKDEKTRSRNKAAAGNPEIISLFETDDGSKIEININEYSNIGQDN